MKAKPTRKLCPQEEAAYLLNAASFSISAVRAEPGTGLLCPAQQVCEFQLVTMRKHPGGKESYCQMSTPRNDGSGALHKSAQCPLLALESLRTRGSKIQIQRLLSSQYQKLAFTKRCMHASCPIATERRHVHVVDSFLNQESPASVPCLLLVVL